MPHTRDPKEYRRRAEKWRAEGEKLPPGATRDAYLEIATGYERLAEMLDRNPALQWRGDR